MRSTFHKTLFWLHLIAGLVCGLVIGVMSVTGVALAFEHQVVEWADSDARRVQPPAADAPRLPVDALLARVREARPEAQVSGVTVYPAADSAVLVSTGRGSGVYVNPYTGEVKELGAQGWRSFFRTMTDWHRWLATDGDSRPVGRAVTGVSNTAFLFLAITGLYLWWPRKWTRKAVRSVVWFRDGLKGKARDFNWHNVIGFWALPVLIVLTASGMVISYPWASNLVYRLTGNEPPAAQGPQAPAQVKVPEPAPGSKPLALDALFAEARAQTPAWESIALRMGGPPRGEAPAKPQQPGGERRAEGGERREGSEKTQQPGGERRAEGGGRGGPQALAFTIRETDAWPLFASTAVSLDPFTGQVLRRETYADYNSGRQLRTWLRFLHTGEALGWPGQLIAALASLGGAFLVWTGFALSWRRFFPRRREHTAPGEAANAATEPEAAG
ncbi:PepSY-associated TM helix domain-containing protein [Myxococcaceae bacterium GXIMD 01537]